MTRQLIEQALFHSDWENLSGGYRGYQVSLGHYGIEQYWCVFYSDDANHRATKSVERRVEKEKEMIEKQLKKLKTQAFSCQKDAEKATKSASKKWKYHQLKESQYQKKKRYAHSGKPHDKTPIKAIEYYALIIKPIKILSIIKLK